MHREGFPTPVVRLGQSNIYLWTEVGIWFEQFEVHKSKGGRKLGQTVLKGLLPEQICTWGGCTNKKFRDHPFCTRHWYTWLTQKSS